MLQSFEVPIIEQVKYHVTSPKQCLNCQLNCSFHSLYVPFPSIRTRPSATCLFLCTFPHHIPPFEVLALLHGTPRASAWHDLVSHVPCFECGILVLSLPYPCEYMFEHGCRFLCATRSVARLVTSARLKSHSALTSKKSHSIGGDLRGRLSLPFFNEETTLWQVVKECTGYF